MFFRKTILTSLVFFLTLSCFAAGDGFFNIGLYYSSHDSTFKNFESQKVLSDELLANITAGYTVTRGVLLGLKYYSFEQNSNKAVSSKLRTSINAAGAGIGINSGEFYAFLGLMVLQSPIQEIASSKTKYYGGDGTIIDIAYLLPFAGMRLGPLVSWCQYSYKEKKVNGILDSNFSGLDESFLSPMFSLFFNF